MTYQSIDCYNENMTRDTKILQSLLDGQVSLKQDVKKGFTEVNGRIDEAINRIDKLGLQLAKLEDDAPTGGEFEDLEKKVIKIQNHPALIGS